jgi:tRNA(Ile)-lysidine synthase
LAGGRDARDDERATLVACSGGADSSALAILLADVRAARVVLAHVVHDMRPRRDALMDRDAARDLALRLGRPFVEVEIEVRPLAGNPESAARTLRYRALARLARAQGCPYVATAHHGDDQLETVLMRLMRGAGPRGLAGVRPSRPLSRSVTLVRPMLAVTHADAERVCRAAGWAWSEDRTNADITRLRSALRTSVTPALRSLAPALTRRIEAVTELLSDCADLVDSKALPVLSAGRASESGLRWKRESLRALPRAVLGEVLRSAVGEVGGRRDRATHSAMTRLRDAIVDQEGAPREFRVSGARVTVAADDVEIAPLSPPRAPPRAPS